MPKRNLNSEMNKFKFNSNRTIMNSTKKKNNITTSSQAIIDISPLHGHNKIYSPILS